MVWGLGGFLGWFFGWIFGQLDGYGWSVVRLPTGSISYICCVGYFGPLLAATATAAATKLFCETANCRTYFLFMPHASLAIAFSTI